MAVGQDEPVAVGPVRGSGVEFQVLFKQNRGEVRHSHRHTGMAGIGGMDRVQRKGTNGGGFLPVFGMFGAERGEIHGTHFL